MRKSFLSGALMMALLSVTVGCSNDETLEEKNNPNSNKITINATSTIEKVDGSSRATLGTDGMTPTWEEGDQIDVIIKDSSTWGCYTFDLSSGAGSASGSFKGTNIKQPQTPDNATMYYIYPKETPMGNGAFLSPQDGSHTKEMIMFGTCKYSTEPLFKFTSKTTILKLNMAIPEGANWTEETTLTANVSGVYYSGILDYGGKWIDNTLILGDITVNNVKVSDGKVTGYVVVIPGTKVTDLKIEVSDGNTKYMIAAYTNETATIPENSVITITKPLKKILVWTDELSSNPSPDEIIQNAINTDDNSLFITSTRANIKGLHTTDFVKLNNALKDKTGINLTLLNQETLPSPNTDTNKDGVFYNCTYLKSISAPELTTIGNYAFYDCPLLTSIKLPIVETIGKYAFNSCSRLESVELPEATSIGEYCFANCTKLKTIKLPKVTEIKQLTFKNTGLTQISEAEIPLVTSIDNNTFYQCASLTKIDLPKVTTVGSYAFVACNKLESVNLPEMTTVGSYAFCTCNALKSIELPKAKETTEAHGRTFENMFQDCHALETVKLPAATVLGSSTFKNCTALTTVELPNVTTINTTTDFNSFFGCTKTNITLTVKSGTNWYEPVSDWKEVKTAN